MNNKNLKFIRPVFPAVFAIVVALLFLIAPVGTAHSQGIASATTNYQPNVSLNSNITWSTFYNGWTPLEYSNGTGNKTVNTDLSSFSNNPITVNPWDIQSKEFGTGTGINLTRAGNWTTTGANGGSVFSAIVSSSSGKISTTLNESLASVQGSVGLGTGLITKFIPNSDLPSNNEAYDFISLQAKISGISGTGIDGYIEIFNTTRTSTSPNMGDAIGYNTTTQKMEGNGNRILGCINQNIYMSIPLSRTALTNEMTNSQGIYIALFVGLPEGTNVYNLEIKDITFGTAPMDLGTTGNQTNQTESIYYGGYGNAHLTTFNPNFPWTEITNGGYSVSTSQHLSQAMNYSAIKTPISSGNYVEEVGYSGNFHLPQGPDLSYSGSNLTLGMNVPGSQIQVLDINGLSYLNDVQNKTNGTVSLINSVNPNSQISFLEYVNYTYSQWNSISSPPGAFSIYGIEYYYWIAIGAVAGLIGLGAGAHRANVKAQQLREIRPPRGR